MLALGQALDVEMQSADMRYRKPRQDAFKGVHGWEEKTGYRVLSCGCVSVCKAYPPPPSCQSASRSTERLWRKGACQSCRAG